MMIRGLANKIHIKIDFILISNRLMILETSMRAFSSPILFFVLSSPFSLLTMSKSSLLF